MKLINLQTKKLGRSFKYYEKIDSTQSEIWRLIQSKNVKNGTLIMSNIQTNGQGTHGRIWHTDEENNIAFSIYVETRCKPIKLEGITLEIAITIKEIFNDFYKVKLQIKYPNDLLCNGKKIGGILTQSKIEEEITKFLVIGIGINTCKMNFSEDIKNIATSIKKETGINVDREKIISEFCNRFERNLDEKLKMA